MGQASYIDGGYLPVKRGCTRRYVLLPGAFIDRPLFFYHRSTGVAPSWHFLASSTVMHRDELSAIASLLPQHSSQRPQPAVAQCLLNNPPATAV
jgi:hypothetical protein